MHGGFFESGDGTLPHADGGGNALFLPGQAFVAEEVPRSKQSHHGFLPAGSGHRQLDAAFLHVKDASGSLALRKDGLPVFVVQQFPAGASPGQEDLGIERRVRHESLLICGSRLIGGHLIRRTLSKPF